MYKLNALIAFTYFNNMFIVFFDLHPSVHPIYVNMCVLWSYELEPFETLLMELYLFCHLVFTSTQNTYCVVVIGIYTLNIAARLYPWRHLILFLRARMRVFNVVKPLFIGKS